MEISEIRQERTELEQAIAKLVADFTQKTEVNVSGIVVKPSIQTFGPNQSGGPFIAITTTASSIEVELVI